MSKLSHFFSWLYEWLSDLKLLAVVVTATIGFWLWMLTMFTLFFVSPLYNMLWVPLPLIVAMFVRRRMDRKQSDVEKAEKELVKTKQV